MLEGKNIVLRQPHSEDATTLLLWENTPTNWKVSETEAPYSLHQMQAYIENANDIRTNKQLRLMICIKETSLPVGTVDLFDVNFKHRRAGIGILIADTSERRKGYASEAILLMENYVRDILEFSQLHCLIHADNKVSISLFEQHNFQKMGVRKNWYTFRGETVDTYFYQKLF